MPGTFTGAKKPKNYIKGSAKAKTFDNGGTNIKVDLLFSDLEKLPRNAAGYIRIIISEMKNVDAYGNTHSIYEDDWTPSPTSAQGKVERQVKKVNQVNVSGRPAPYVPVSKEDSGLPF